MTRRPVRVALVCLGVLLTGGLGYRAWLDEQTLTASRNQSFTFERTSDDARNGVANLRATLNAAVAANQEAAGWLARADVRIDTLRQLLTTLDVVATSSGGSLAEALQSVDQLVAAEKRVHGHIDNGQPLLAADLIFTEMPAQLDAVDRQVATARLIVRHDLTGRIASLGRRQAAEVAVATVLWVAVAALLVPLGRSAAALAPLAAVAAASTDGLDLSLTPEGFETPVEGAGGDVPRVQEPVPRAESRLALTAVADVCTDLSSLSDHESLAGALARACDLLGATGAIVWIASPDGRSLSPGLAHGYDTRVIGRIGSIPADANNLTAEVFRDGAARRTSPAGATPAALAVPIIGAAGPVGVLSAELRVEHVADDDLVALATIFAAQLATLTLPAPASPAALPDARRQAHA